MTGREDAPQQLVQVVQRSFRRLGRQVLGPSRWAERLTEQASRCGDAQLVNAIDALSAAVAAMREGDDPRLSLEVALLKVAQPSLDHSREALLGRIEQLEARIGNQPEVASKPRPVTGSDSDPVPVPNPGPRTDADPSTDADPTAGADPEAATAMGAGIDEVLRLWPAVVEHIRLAGAQMLASLLGDARPLEVEADGSKLRIGFPAASTFNKRKAESAENLTIVAEALKAVVGGELTPAYALTNDAATPVARDDKPKMGEEEVIDMVKAKFDAKELKPDTATSEGEAAGH